MRVAYRGFPAERRFGVELEVSNNIPKKILGRLIEDYECSHGNHAVKVTSGMKGWAETRRNAYWHVKYDSTCGPKGKYHDYGWEVASFIGEGLSDLHVIAGLADHLHQNNVEVNNNCGLHIHVDAEDLAPWQMGLVLARWIKVEEIITLICPMRRWRNSYCRALWERAARKRIRYRYDAPDLFWTQMAPLDLSTHSNEEKKYTLNTVGYAIGMHKPDYDRQTVELRLPECLLSTEHVLNWTRLIVNFIDHTQLSWHVDHSPDNIDCVSTVCEMLQWLGLHRGKDEFLILDDQLLDTKIWLLKKIVATRILTREFREEALSLLRFISKI
jgi:hypothetical protein